MRVERASPRSEGFRISASRQTLLGSLNERGQEGRSMWHAFEGSLWKNWKEEKGLL